MCETPTPEPTITESTVIKADCEHCEAQTMQVIGGHGILVSGDEGTNHERACLQCIADGGTCCSLAPLNRRA